MLYISFLAFGIWNWLDWSNSIPNWNSRWREEIINQNSIWSSFVVVRFLTSSIRTLPVRNCLSFTNWLRSSTVCDLTNFCPPLSLLWHIGDFVKYWLTNQNHLSGKGILMLFLEIFEITFHWECENFKYYQIVNCAAEGSDIQYNLIKNHFENWMEAFQLGTRFHN